MELNATLFGQMITFLIFALVVINFVWPPISQALDERKKKISDGLLAAEEANQKLELAEVESSRLLSKTKSKCDKLLQEAQQRAGFIVEQSRVEAEDTKSKVLESGYKELELALNKAKIDLQNEYSSLVIKGAEKVISRSINQHDHKNLLDNLSRELM
jgi:F-type H+-transporting ATPase subunit b